MSPSAERLQARRTGWWSMVALVTWALSLSALVGADGSIEWRLVRIGVVIAITAAALWLSERTLRLGACVAIACGTIGLVVGIVFGLRFLTVDGLSWRAAAGLVELVAGLVLVAAGVRRLVSGLARGRRFVAGAAMVFAVLLAAWTLTPAVLAMNVPPIPVEATPTDFGLTAREVRFIAADGVELWAWYVPSDNGAAVVLRHGSGSTGSNVLAQAEVLARDGYGVLVTDARGHGRSGGRALELAASWVDTQSRRDIAAKISQNLDFLATE